VDGERGIFHRGRTRAKKLRWGELSLMLGPTLQEFSVGNIVEMLPNFTRCQMTRFIPGNAHVEGLSI
jgi:hypothetical protein